MPDLETLAAIAPILDAFFVAGIALVALSWCLAGRWDRSES